MRIPCRFVLPDGSEVLNYGTSPGHADTDNDDLDDYAEVILWDTHPSKTDTDGGGRSDGDEVYIDATNPLYALDDLLDTDQDGLTDVFEIQQLGTDPNRADTDGDTLSDGVEVYETHTNPLDPDTDGGSVSDDVEVARGTNPNNPDDDLLEDIHYAGAQGSCSATAAPAAWGLVLLPLIGILRRRR